MKKLILTAMAIVAIAAVSANATVWNVNFGSQQLTDYVGAAPENTADGYWNSVETAGDPVIANATLLDSMSNDVGVTLVISGTGTPQGKDLITGDLIFNQGIKSHNNSDPWSLAIGNLKRHATYDLVLYSDWFWGADLALPVTQTAGVGLIETIYVNRESHERGYVGPLSQDTDPANVSLGAGTNFYRITGLTPDPNSDLAFEMGGADTPLNGFQLVEILGALPYNPSPKDDPKGLIQVVSSSSLPLTWTNIDPNLATGATETLVDVWFGTDPCNLSPVIEGQNVNAVNVNALADGQYYWQVNSDIGEENKIEGVIWTFHAVSDAAPAVTIDTPDQMTWSGEPVDLVSTVTNDDDTTVIVWTAYPADGVTIEGGDTATPTVTIDKTEAGVATVTLTVAVTDSGNPDPETAAVQIDVYDDACHMARSGQGMNANTDFNNDCVTDLVDLAVIAAAWLDDYSATGQADR